MKQGDRIRSVAVALALCALVLLLVSAAAAETRRKGNVLVGVDAKLSPKRLPRHGKRPITVSFSGKIKTTDSSVPPQLQEIAIEINRYGTLTYRGIPKCRIGRIDPSTTRAALNACRSSLVGTGRFSADVKIPEQSPFPSRGRVLAFNGRFKGRPAILAHIYGTKPAPTSYLLPFVISRARGTYGTELKASLPRVTGEWGFVTGISLKLNRSFRYHGHSHSYMAAGCPAPRGFTVASFPLARTSFAFEGGKTLTSVLNRSCRVKGR